MTNPVTASVEDGAAEAGLHGAVLGLPLPVFAVELARDRLSKRYLTRATLEAEIFSPEGALAAGYLDSVTAADLCVSAAIEEARRLGAIDQRAYANTKQALRRATIGRVLAMLDGVMASFAGASN